jgi:cobalt/nickel transport system permease protein
MNVPDGFIPLWQCFIYAILMLISWIFTLKWLVGSLLKLKKEESNFTKLIKYIILVLFLMAFTFILQAFVIPVPYGVGISLIGAAIITIILRSPWGAVLVMTPVLLTQWLLFGYGGLTTMGVNIINSGVVAGLTGFYVFRLAKPLDKILRTLLGGFFSGFLSLFFASLAVSVEFWLAGTFPLAKGIMWMGMYSSMIGILEGIMTMIVCIILLVLKSQAKKSRINKKVTPNVIET